MYCGGGGGNEGYSIEQVLLCVKMLSSLVQLSFSPLTDLVVGGGHEGRLSRDPVLVFLREALASISGWMSFPVNRKSIFIIEL